ncbi:helix-turn-helix domain-containing protein [Mucilaginibacter pedocola]|uniref:AraC family transcriptional regulator n=1 Tax=Mucilaginibacter pedocola TaxID=1792845 RepID=A0A1S9PCL1_9SPHI|nr:AraC family transcriptional regulator [Mucilaginibacter pedocola]OOQ58722.1 AraC family transcriptional regulator [Mucilaginibacter pedocola]
MKIEGITSCYIGPAISPEQFIPEHFFIYLLRGSIVGYDGHRNSVMRPGEYCIARKNHLARYSKQPDAGEFAKVVVIFDEAFLKGFQQRHKIAAASPTIGGSFLPGEKSGRVQNFVQSLEPYYRGNGQLDEPFADLKREELLLILLQIHPDWAGILFDFGIPEKIDLEAFMNKNYKFNVSIERFAYLTGRSISSFKRDFRQIFNDTPSRWLIQKRLREAYFLISKKGKKPSDIYLDIGFEDLSHFSFAFKKLFGATPGSLLGKPS